MALITRLSRLFVADVHDMLDQLEEPGAVLRQAVREMEAEVLNAEQGLRSLRQAREAGGRQLKQLEDELERIAEKVGLAMDAGDAGLARDMLRRRLLAQQHVEKVRSKLDQLKAEISRRSEQLADWQVRLDSARQKLALAAPATEPERPRDCVDLVSNQDVEVAYLAELKKRGAA